MVGMPKRIVLVAIAAMAMALTALPASAGAATVGQINSFGTFGSGNGQFTDPSGLGIDTSDGSVYSVSLTADRKSYRLQKLSSTGTFIAAATFPRFTSEEFPIGVMGVAVDPTLHRVYLVETEKPGGGSIGELLVTRLRVFSTENSGTTLVAASPATLALPTDATQ